MPKGLGPAPADTTRMGPGLSALEQMISHTLGVSGPQTADLEVLPGGAELSSFLQRCNGFYAFGDALHVFPSGAARRGELTLEEWNTESLWRDAYPRSLVGHLCFAEDAVGNQFTLSPNGVFRFDAETAALEFVAPNLESWALSVLADVNRLTGFPLAHAWKLKHGAMPLGHRLVPRRAFCRGGQLRIDNLVNVDAVDAMRARGLVVSRDRPAAPAGPQQWDKDLRTSHPFRVRVPSTNDDSA